MSFTRRAGLRVYGLPETTQGGVMPSTRTVHAAPRPRRRRRQGGAWAAGGLALGISSALGLGALPAGAGTTAPTAFVDCSADALLGRISGFPPNETFLFLAIVGHGDGSNSVYQGFSISTDESGSGNTGLSAPAGTLPDDIDFVVYRDTNPNSRWDPDSDDTVYKGAGTVTACPQTVTLSPK
jgi:hypothetical protein